MLDGLKAYLRRPSLRNRLVVGGLVMLVVWFVFFDSHSLLKRVQYAQERSALIEEIHQLRETNEALELRLSGGLTDELVEEVAREQFGMRRSGETVYPIEESD